MTKAANEAKFSWLDTARAIWYFLDEDKVKFGVFFTLLSSVFFYSLVPPYVVGKMVDFLTNHKTGESVAPLYYYILFFAVTYVLVSLIRLKSKNVLSIIGRKSRARARIWGFERLAEFSVDWHAEENTGSKLQRIFTGANSINNISRVLRQDFLKLCANIIGVTAVFLFTDSKFIALISAYVALFFLVEFIFSRKLLALSNEFNTLNQSASGTYVEGASNMLSIKALGSEDTVAKRVTEKEILSRDISIKKSTTGNIKWRFFQFLNGTSLGIFLVLLAGSVLAEDITIGMFLVYFNYFDKLQSSLGDLTDVHTDMIDLRSDIAHMMPIFQSTEFIKTGNDPFPGHWNTIEFRDVRMEYGSGQNGLEGFSLTLPKNTKTGIAGSSGSGKSTLAKVILGLYAINKGEFKIGDKDYYAISHNEMLGNVTVVLQETELFNLSLRDNITMMRDEDPELLKKAIDISELGPVIDKLPQGLDSLIGEKGYMLSGGERQRLGIARAVYKDAPIVILDEATSSLDSGTEAKIMAKLLGGYGKSKTFLIIAHRLGTLRYTDNVAVMEQGRIVEEGTYDSLMSDSSSSFYQMNTREQKK